MSTVAAVEQLPTLARNNNTKLAAGDTCIFKPVYTWSEGALFSSISLPKRMGLTGV
jgi:hypothetical protein